MTERIEPSKVTRLDLERSEYEAEIDQLRLALQEAQNEKDNLLIAWRESRSPEELYFKIKQLESALQDSQQRVKELEHALALKELPDYSLREDLRTSMIQEGIKTIDQQQAVIQQLAEALRKCADGLEADGYDVSDERAALAKVAPWLRKEEK